MYNPFGGNKFPYTNFHELNLDWIIEIAKNFLDQYTNIQDIITQGETSLEEKAQELEDLLQQWYDTHSEDIAQQLANAVEEFARLSGLQTQQALDDFNQAAEAKGAQVIASIPADYTTLATDVLNNSNETDNTARHTFIDGEFWKPTTGDIIDTGTYAGMSRLEKIRCKKGDKFVLRTQITGTPPTYMVIDSQGNILSSGIVGVYDGLLEITDEAAYYICVNTTLANKDSFVLYLDNNNSINPLKDSIADIKSELTTEFIPSRNLVNLPEMTSHIGYFNDDGGYQNSSNYRYYIIPVEPETSYVISFFRHYLTFWNYADQCITSASTGTSGQASSNTVIHTPELCRYIKVTFWNNNDLGQIPNFSLTKGTTVYDERLTPYPTLNPKVNIDNLFNIIKMNRFFSPMIEMSIGGTIGDTDGMIYYTNSANVAASDRYYSMIDGAKYIFWGDNSTRYNVYFYDADKQYVTSITSNSDTLTTQRSFTNSNNYKYMRFGAYRTGGITDNLTSVHATMTLDPKKVVCLGDSFTAGVGADILYHMFLAEATGWTCLNYGAGGAGWSWNMTASTLVGDGAEGVGTVHVPAHNTDFQDAVEYLPTDADLYIVFGGYNDWNTDQTESNFRTAVENTITYLQDHMTQGRILVLTPAQRYIPNGKDGRNANLAGLTLKDYGDIILDICKTHGVQCIDLYNTSGLYPYSTANRTHYYADDGLHLNDNGQKMLFDRIYDTCISLNK